MKAVTSKIRWIAMVVGMAVVASCGTGAPAQVTAPIKFSFPVAKSILTTLSSVTLSVSASDMTTVTSTQTGPFSSDISFTVNVPVGSSRAFTATALIQDSTTEGYEGTATADVSTSGGSVPLTMLQVNFSTDPATTSSGPQITSLSALYVNSDVSLFIDFTSQVETSTISGVVEFIPAAATAFRSQSIIDQLKGTVDVTMPSPGSSYIIFNGTGSGIDAKLYDRNDSEVTVVLQSVMSGLSTIEIRMPQTAFETLIDSAILGKFNVLAGSNLSMTTPLTPTHTTDFTPSSAAVGSGGGNAIVYRGSLATSSATSLLP